MFHFISTQFSSSVKVALKKCEDVSVNTEAIERVQGKFFWYFFF